MPSGCRIVDNHELAHRKWNVPQEMEFALENGLSHYKRSIKCPFPQDITAKFINISPKFTILDKWHILKIKCDILLKTHHILAKNDALYFYCM